MERAKRIELSSQPWQGRVLPLNHARKNQFDYLFIIANLCQLYKFYPAASSSSRGAFRLAFFVEGVLERGALSNSWGAMDFK